MGWLLSGVVEAIVLRGGGRGRDFGCRSILFNEDVEDQSAGSAVTSRLRGSNRARQEDCVNGSSFPCAAGYRGSGKVGILGLDFHFPTAHKEILAFGVWLSSCMQRCVSSWNCALTPAAVHARFARCRVAAIMAGGRRLPLLRSPERVLRNTLLQQNRKALQGRLPVLHRHGPLLGDMFQRQE